MDGGSLNVGCMRYHGQESERNGVGIHVTRVTIKTLGANLIEQQSRLGGSCCVQMGINPSRWLLKVQMLQGLSSPPKLAQGWAWTGGTAGLSIYIHPPQPPNYARIDPQFGFKPTVDINNCFWSMRINESIGSSPSTASTDNFIQTPSAYGVSHVDDNLDMLGFNFSVPNYFADDQAYF
ncbi:hypothetical protein EDD18DRAFT_1103294 [Armillaria luteobubalina]|uniref:Uncharacterized protein n=1 Tax=Armillaria luteobubalina TaxID=153913 RepID=A0AA39UQT8_9AGAR|nr:hypothetical protein EDD18DRAFT_1103294 [Armillaria luteobubalina]